MVERRGENLKEEVEWRPLYGGGSSNEEVEWRPLYGGAQAGKVKMKK